MIERLRKVYGILPTKSAALVTNPANIFYLTGYDSDAGSLLITAGGYFFFIDGRYIESAKAVIARNFADEIGAEYPEVILVTQNFHELLTAKLAEFEIKKLFVESTHFTLDRMADFILKHEGIEFDSTPELSNKLTFLRSVKTADEIQKIDAAQRIADAAFKELCEQLEPGITERQIANKFDFLIRDHGADSVAFPTIAASGPNSAIPHAVPTDREIRAGDFLLLDFGARLNGYCSDTTRTVSIGRYTEEQEKIYNAVLSANQDTEKRLKSGLSAKAFDTLARHTLEVWGGYDKYFTHSLGHGVGTLVHEAPTLSEKSSETLAENMVVTVEPGVYLPGKFGVRIEDMFVITKSGAIRMSKLPRAVRVIKV